MNWFYRPAKTKQAGEHGKLKITLMVPFMKDKLTLMVVVMDKESLSMKPKMKSVKALGVLES